jgi:hypothetical protein
MGEREISERIGSIVGAMICVGLPALLVFGPLVAPVFALVAGGIIWLSGLNFFQEMDKWYSKSSEHSQSESSSASSFGSEAGRDSESIPEGAECEA